MFNQTMLQFYLPLFILSIYSSLQIGASITLLKESKKFTNKAKKIYILLSLGLLTLGISKILSVTFNLTSTGDINQTHNLILNILNISGSISILYFFIQYIKIAKIKTQLASPLFLIPLGILIPSIFNAIAVLNPHILSIINYIDLMLNSVIAVLLILSAFEAHAITNWTGYKYRYFNLWLMDALIIDAIGFLLSCLSKLGGSYIYLIPNEYSQFFFMTSSIFYFMAVISLKNTNKIKPENTQTGGIFNIISELASNKNNIAFLLNKAQQAQAYNDTPEKLNFLRTIYLELEYYLISKEPVKNYTKTEIRTWINDNMSISQKKESLLNQLVFIK